LFADDGIINDDGRLIETSEQGKLFTTLVCRTFDKHARFDSQAGGILKAEDSSGKEGAKCATGSWAPQG
jgi:hypothetical protein